MTVDAIQKRFEDEGKEKRALLITSWDSLTEESKKEFAKIISIWKDKGYNESFNKAYNKLDKDKKSLIVQHKRLVQDLIRQEIQKERDFLLQEEKKLRKEFTDDLEK